MQILGTIALCVLLTLTSATSTDPDVLIADGMTFALRTQTLDGMETTRYVAQAEGPPVTTALSTRTTQNGDTTITDTVTLVRYMTGDELEDSSTSSAAAAISSAESSQISFLTPAATNSAEETEEDNDHSSTITLTSTYAVGQRQHIIESLLIWYRKAPPQPSPLPSQLMQKPPRQISHLHRQGLPCPHQQARRYHVALITISTLLQGPWLVLWSRWSSPYP